MIEQISKLMRQANAEKMNLSIQNVGENFARIVITTQFKTPDDGNVLQRTLSYPIAAAGYVGSLESDLANKLQTLDIENAPHQDVKDSLQGDAEKEQHQTDNASNASLIDSL